MMNYNYYYSPKMNSFYPADLHKRYEQAGSWPSDALGISDEIFNQYSVSPPAGKIRVSSGDGLPSWGEIPPPTHEEQKAMAVSKKQSLIDQANEYINGKQWPGKAALGRLKDEELERYSIWLDYLDTLYAVDISTAPEIIWPTSPEKL